VAEIAALALASWEEKKGKGKQEVGSHLIERRGRGGGKEKKDEGAAKHTARLY